MTELNLIISYSHRIESSCFSTADGVEWTGMLLKFIFVFASCKSTSIRIVRMRHEQAMRVELYV